MTKSTRRTRTATRSGIAAASVVSLALGAFAVVGPGPVATEAAAAELSGGIREKSGAVEEGAQQASDLPAGSCVVKSGETSGNQAGFRWSTLEPSGTSPSKTLWGLSVSFDNSKDRTFADWNFFNTGGLGNVLDVGQVSSMEADGKSVTHKADEIIKITPSGRALRNLNLEANLTDEEVKEFASASADNPVRYAWQSNYTKDNPNGPYATQGGSASFGATVNPWPSENIECNPITVSWETAEVSEKHVIVPGEETKVGTINVPALSDGKTDDSMSRMVVEAYDGNGKFIGTTDPSVSGGEQLLRIDEDGNIFFTWPEYRGTALATDKNVNFSVLAKPRTVAQLQAASDNNTYEKAGKAFDSSNSLTRYNKANVIDSKAFSLDDTKYHDPQYDKTDATIISGVDSNGNLTDQPQEVVFKQVPDLIKDLEKKKGAGGFEAKVTLDEKYVYEGWTVEMDEDYNVTVIAPENPRPGTFAQPRVVVEYSNGSKDELSLLVVVDPNHTQVTDLVRPDLSKGKVNDPITAQITTTSILDGYDPVAPKTFEVDQSTVPAGWTVTVDNTGKVTAKADDTVAPGTIITPKVTATYPDGTTDDVETQFQAIVDIKIPTYDTVTNKPGTEVSLTPTVPERGLSGNTTDEAPKRYTFEDGETEYTHTDDSGTWTVKIDENTGEITTTIPQTAPEGYILNVPVLTHYDNADKPQQVKGSVVVLKGDIAPVYSVESTGPNKAVDHQVQDAPKGSTFSFGKNPNGTPITEMTTEDGWKYTIDPDTGVVTSTPPADAKPGDKKTITVDVVTPNGSTSKVPVTTVVKLTNSWEAEPSYPAETVYPGETATSPLTIQKPEGVEVAKENPYVIQPAEGYTATGENNEFGNPTYTVTTENGEWIVGLDDKGNVVATAPKTAKPGDKINVPVKVTYSDGSTDDVTAPIAVKDNPKRPVPFGVEYVYDDTIPAGEYRTVTKGVAGEEKQKRDGTWEQTTAPTNEVVHVGTKQAEASEDVTWTVPIPYSTTTRPNPALAPGETKVVQQGVNGERTYTAKFTAAGDQASVVESEVKKEPVEEIIEYGPRLADQQLVTQTTRPIPFDTTIVYDDTLEAGKQVVDKEGVVGEEKVTSTQKLVDGKPSGEPVVTTDTTKPKQDAVIRVGTKTTPTIGEQLVDIPFTTKIVYDPTLQPGDRVVDVAGQNGQVKVTVTNGVPTVKTVKEPVQEVVRVGTKPADGVEWTEETPYAVKVEEDPNLEAGKYVVAQEGVPGKTVHHADGTETKTPAKDHIIKVGTKNADSVKSTFKAPIPAPVRIVYDDSLPAGTYQEDPNNPGVDGEKEVTVTRKMVNGQPTGEPVVEEKVLTEAKPKVIKVGTKQPEAGENVTWTEPIPFTTEFRENPALKPGETKVVQEGKDGEATYKIGFKANGESATVENTNQRVEPVNRIIEYGPGPDDDQISSQVTRPIEFKTSVIYDETLEEGKQVITQGELGEEVVTTTQKIVDGKPSGNPVVTTEQTKAPKNAVIRIGTKKPGAPEPEPEITQDVELPFTTKIVYDPTLKPGERVVDTPGQPGKVKVTVINGRAEVSTVKEPVQEVVRVGTKPADDVEYTYETPYKVKVETDPTLPAGEVKVVQPGKVGLVKVVGTTETVVNEPVDQIIKIGTQTPLGYPATETPVEKQVKVKANTSKPGLTYRLGEVPEGWTATINESTGELTVTPGPTVKDGDTVDIPVIATDADTGAEYGTYAKVKATAKPSVPGGNDSSSEKANQIAKQCFGNALQSPIAWLLPVALLSVVVGKLIEPYMGQINAQFDAINRQIQQNLPKHGHGGHGGNDQLNEQIAYINGQFQAFASNPTVQMVGKVIGGALALGALIGLLYDWCSAEVGQAKTSIDFSKRGGKNVFQDGEGSSTKGGNQQGGSSN